VSTSLDLRSNRQIERQVRALLARWRISTTLCDRALMSQQRRPFWWMHAVTVTPPPQSWPTRAGWTQRTIPCPCRRCRQQAA
jgi:hypothetical protein